MMIAKTQQCPICGKPPTAAFKPFCSKGCRDRDLLQWLGEGYRLPAGPAEQDERDSRDDVGGVDSDETAD